MSTEQNRLPSVSGTSLHLREQIYERYSQPRVDFRAWVLERVPWRGGERVLDVGTGPGSYYALLRELQQDIGYAGLDFSAAELAAHPGKPRVAQADAACLPYASAQFDVVLANHMLYHVADRERAIREFRRVLKPDGLLVASTNSIHTMPEFQAVMRHALVLLGVTGRAQAQAPAFPHAPFSLENGPRQLAQHFYAVVRHDLPTSLIFPTVESVMEFLDSTRDLREPLLPAGILWEDLMLVMYEQIQALFGHFGELVVNKLSGVLIASDSGGFIHDFVTRRNSANGTTAG